MLRFNALGPVAALRDGEPVDLGSRKQKSVLAVLIANIGQPVHTDRIIEAVWGDGASPTARRSVQTYVSNLRRSLDDGQRSVLVGTSDGYMLSDEGVVSVDWVEFEAAQVDGSIESCRHALELWSGDPFEDVENDWARPLVTAWREQRLATLETWAELMTEQGRAVEVVPDLERAIANHPIRESLWAQLMLCHVAAGRPAEALATYRRLQLTLREEMGIEPSPDLRDLEERILFEEESAQSRAQEPIGSSLPADRTRLVGREAELRRLKNLMGVHRLITMVGPGGSGKTRLAIAAARDAHERGEVPVYFADLSGLSGGEQVPMAIATALGIQILDESGTGRSVLTQIVAATSGKVLLMVVDNCEHVVTDAAEAIDAILGSAEDISILATSREVLGVAGELRLQVPPLALAVGDQRPALELFIDRASAVTDGSTFTAEEQAVFDEVCRSLEGMPLAIELAAAQLAFLNPDELLASLSERLTMSGGRGRGTRHRTLRATMEWSWSLLTPDEARFLKEASVFAGGWTLPAAQGVCSGSEGEVRDILGALVAKSLVQVENGMWGSRYRLLETVRLYSLEQLGQDAEAVRRHHATWFSVWCDSWSLEDQWASGSLASQLLQDWDNLRTALFMHVGDGDMTAATNIVFACISLWRLNHAGKEALDWTGMIDAENLSEPSRVRLLLALATARQVNHDFPAMWRLAEEAVTVARATGEPDLLSVALGTGAFGYLMVNLRANEEKWHEVLAAAQEARLPRIEGSAWAMLAIGSYMSGDAPENYDSRLKRALPKVGQDGWDHSVGALAALHLRIADGNFAEACKSAGEKVSISEQLGLHLDAARCRLMLAYAAARAEERDRWTAALRAAHDHFSMAWGSRADADVVLSIAVWEVFVGDPYLGSELLSVVRHIGLEFPENYLLYRGVRMHLQKLDLDSREVAAARSRGTSLPVGEVLEREFRRLGWL